MTTTVLQTSQIHLAVSTLFHNQRSDPMVLDPSSSRITDQSSRLPSSPPVPEKTFKRLRSSLEQSIRSATRSRASKGPSITELGTLSQNHNKGKERVAVEPDPKSKSRILKVAFRRSGQDLPPLSPVLAESRSGRKGKDVENVLGRSANLPSFSSPSLRQASQSSPTLHLYSHPGPASHVQTADPVASGSNGAGLSSPPRDHKKPSDQSGASERDISTSVSTPARNSSSPTPREVPHRTKSQKHRPQPLLPKSSSTASLETTRGKNASGPQTPTLKHRDKFHVPESPSPYSRRHSGGPNAATASSSQLSINGTAPTPSPNGPNHTRTRSPSIRHHLSSSSSSNLPSVSPPGDVKRSSLEYQKPRRPSLDSQRGSVSPSRTVSSTQIRPRAVSPSPRNFSPNYAQNRHFNTSTTSLSSAASPDQRELLRNATSLLCKELLKPPGYNTTGLGVAELEEIEIRMRALARLERIWGKSRSNPSGSNAAALPTSGLSSSGLSAAGEEREKRLFSDALRDGYVLCQLMNKCRPGAIARVDKREDGIARTSNVIKFLASCSTLGLSSNDMFMRDDLIEGSYEALARVARCIIVVVQTSENTSHSKFSREHSLHDTGPYNNKVVSRGTASTPNLFSSQARRRSISPTVGSAPIPIPRKRRSQPTGLPPMHSKDSLGSGNDGDVLIARNSSSKHDDCDDQDLDEVSPIRTPPPRSPLRPRPSVERTSLTDSNCIRQSLASSAFTDTTTYSSLLEVQRSSSVQNKYGTIRTVTTEATSFAASDIQASNQIEPNSVPEEMGRKRPGVDSNTKQRERKPSETAIVDLSRVAEETEDSGTSSRGKGTDEADKSADQEVVKPKFQKVAAIRLGKAKWPDDFFDAVPQPKFDQVLSQDSDELSALLSSTNSKPVIQPSISPPRKLAIVARGNDSNESLPQFPRKPTHRTRHSIDNPVLLPKENVYPRDPSPDDRGFSSNSRVVLRRASGQNGTQRTGVYLPRRSLDDSRPSNEGDSQVPFPRTVSGDHSSPLKSKISSDPISRSRSPQDKATSNDRPVQPRGRFQSEVDGASSRRRPRPSSYEDLGPDARRSRFESMMNLGVASGNASASDLLSRSSLEGNVVRQTLIVREEGKAATQFQLGNCIGRGQFGAVYRALNLNTGQMVAVKRISLSGLKEEEISQLMKEVDLLKSLSHPGIVKYEGMARDQDTLSIVLEFAENGSLGQTLKAFGKLNERLVASYVVKILEGLHYLHQSDVVHCDLKAANILTTKTGNVKLSDFGVSLNLRAMGREMKDVAGTPNWMAPEIIELKGASTKSDIWSLACTVIELLTGRPPYAEIANGMSVMFRIVEDEMPPLPEGISNLLADFLKQCFNKDPSKRPDADILFEHEWLKQNWGLHKELRPQDSIPFLRRVSADLHKPSAAEAVRLLGAIDQSQSEPPRHEEADHVEDSPMSTPRASIEPDPISPREHSFVKTTFGKPVICRVCLLTVKRTAVLCDQCSLIAHSKCASNAPPTCNLRAQLLLYAQYADKGTPPMDILGRGSSVPTSDGGYTSRTSFDRTVTPQPSPGQSSPPPATHKIKSVFKRSRNSPTAKLRHTPSSTSGQVLPAPRGQKLSRKSSFFMRRSGHTQSISSASTSHSTRSTADGSSSRNHPGSILSEDDEDGPEQHSGIDEYSVLSAATNLDYREAFGDQTTGDSPSRPHLKNKESSSSNGSKCVVQ